MHPVIQALIEQVKFLIEGIAHCNRPGRRGIVRQGKAPNLGPVFPSEVQEVLQKARQKIGLGHQHVNRKLHAQAVTQFSQPGFERGGVDLTFLRGHLQQVRYRQGEQHPVEWLARAEPFEQAHEALPFRLVDRLIAFLSGVAPRRVDQDRFIGEPPIAIAGTADTPDCGLAKLFSQGKRKPGVDQCRGLARSRGPDEGIPGQLVHILLRQAGQKPAFFIGREAGLFQYFGRFLEAAVELGHLFAAHRLPLAGLGRLHLCQLTQQRTIDVALTPPADGLFHQPQQPEADNHTPAHPFGPEWLPLGTRHRHGK